MSEEEKLNQKIETYKNTPLQYCLTFALWGDLCNRVYETEAAMQEYIDWLTQKNIESPGDYVVIQKYKLEKPGEKSLEKEEGLKIHLQYDVSEKDPLYIGYEEDVELPGFNDGVIKEEFVFPKTAMELWDIIHKFESFSGVSVSNGQYNDEKDGLIRYISYSLGDGFSNELFEQEVKNVKKNDSSN